jgi:hypothetical protein
MNKFYFLSASIQEMSVNKLWMDRCSAALVTHSSIHGTGVLLCCTSSYCEVGRRSELYAVRHGHGVSSSLPTFAYRQ